MKTLKEVASAMEVGYDVVWRAKQRLQEAGMWGDTEKDALMGTNQAVLVTPEQEGLLRQEIEQGSRVRNRVSCESGQKDSGTSNSTTQMNRQNQGKSENNDSYVLNFVDDAYPQSSTQKYRTRHKRDTKGKVVPVTDTISLSDFVLPTKDMPWKEALNHDEHCRLAVEALLNEFVKTWYKDKYKRHLLKHGVTRLLNQNDQGILHTLANTPGLQSRDVTVLAVVRQVMNELYRWRASYSIMDEFLPPEAQLPGPKTAEQIAKEEGWLF